MAKPGDEYVLAWIRDKQDAKKEAELRGIEGIKPDFEIGFLLEMIDDLETTMKNIEDGWQS